MRYLVTLVSLVLAALPLGALAQSATPIATIDPAAYCVEKGGKVVHRTPALRDQVYRLAMPFATPLPRRLA